MYSKDHKFKIFNSLAGVVAGLEGSYTTIDLRNETVVTGRVVEVDGEMNMELEDATFYDARGVEKGFSNFYVNARSIRHIHLPKNKSPQDLFDLQESKMKKSFRPRKVIHNYKTSRARRYHAETERDAYKNIRQSK